ncbi:MAG TPA: glycoside hydrolase family 6 protein [Solirubrobacteraceae bacterium]|nr:glycoside hydrolase family 6 protein [Solirubrobacteraceae bacterium]
MILSLGLLGALLVPAAAHADASTDPSGFRLQSSALTVNENAGQAVITVERTDTSEEAQIRYITLGDGVPCGPAECTAVDAIDFTSVKGELDFPVGVASETFTVPIVDHDVSGVPKTIQVSLFGPSPIGMASPSKAVLTILNDDPVTPHDSQNPLALPVAPDAGNPLSGATFFVDPDSEAAHAALQNPALDVIAREPGTARFGSFSFGNNGVPNIATAVSRYLSRAQVESPGTVPLIATYRIVHGLCGHASDSPADVASYHNFIQGFAQGIGSYRAVLFLEMDSIITMPCLSRHGKAVREHELRYAINILTANCPHLVIYLDAGAADALSARDAAKYLRASGIAKIQGFFLNATHFDWTSHEIRYGEQISRMTGGEHFVVNTGENGQGPMRPRDIVHSGNEVLCNPPGRGLGPLPTADTGYRNVDMFAWTTNPGESGGPCVPGAPPTGVYWPAYAAMLVQNADFNVR